ncbi:MULTISPECIES: triose-phosphate isomerase [Chelativorans]|jgi:triosephosphate isomerase|uniref:Triosephosphate isomerase n=1 Tax=Chelativorans sp. (strain BNC1) TaxID=266779 RepID=TPIS_CHESB|nr:MULTISPECIES: triose-phosphate isomerase [Chelativorans]Q11HU4.1 RecName: Full=Triosephosphate isomerase; Short=TIM; Short=TPI; AltName: Full=Triose-phosphate isomerase [Chelativorans sp. BNC1]
MTPTIRPLIAGNWKMHGTESSLGELKAIGSGFVEAAGAGADGVICVPATLLARASDILAKTPVATGGQDCHPATSGAHTGDIAAEMLADCGASYVIVGHSERRTDHHEADEDVAAKAEAAWRAGLTAIICIGETKIQREAGETLSVLSRQIAGSVPPGATAKNSVIAYEPVWAIGTGLTPTVEDVAQAHAHLRAELGMKLGIEADGMRLLYGGSVKPSNAGELLSILNVDGALIGGASLKAADFLAISAAVKGK